MRRFITFIVLSFALTNFGHAGEIQPGTCELAVAQASEEANIARSLLENMADIYPADMSASNVTEISDILFTGLDQERFVEYAQSMLIARHNIRIYLEKLDAFTGALAACVDAAE